VGTQGVCNGFAVSYIGITTASQWPTVG